MNNVPQQVDLGEEDAKADHEHALAIELGRVVRLHQVADREDVELLRLAPVHHMHAVLLELLELHSEVTLGGLRLHQGHGAARVEIAASDGVAILRVIL